GAARPVRLRGRGRPVAEARHDGDEGGRVLAGSRRRHRGPRRSHGAGAQVGDEVSERTQNRVFAVCGIASVVLLLAGSLLGSAGGQPSYTLASSPAHVAHELATPVDPLGWAGAYVELLSFGCFL